MGPDDDDEENLQREEQDFKVGKDWAIPEPDEPTDT